MEQEMKEESPVQKKRQPDQSEKPPGIKKSLFVFEVRARGTENKESWFQTFKQKKGRRAHELPVCPER